MLTPAGQLARVQLRTVKLQSQAKHQRVASSNRCMSPAHRALELIPVHRPLFFLHSLTSPHPLSLASLRALISTVYLTRHDDRIKELDGERRAGRPKAKEQLELEDVRKREWAEYETGMGMSHLLRCVRTTTLYANE